jgi:PAS domain S-box-containing protein
MSHKSEENSSMGPEENMSKEELILEVRELRKNNSRATKYIREKVNQLLTVAGTCPLKPNELDDLTLIELDPIGIISDSFTRVLLHLKQTNEELKVAHDEISAIFDSAGMGILVVDRDMRVLAFNRMLSEQFRIDPNMSAAMHCNQLICHKEQREHCPAERAIKAGSMINADLLLDGRHFDVVATPIRREKDGVISQVVLVYMDMTERILAEEKIRRSEERYRDLFENSTDLIQILGADSSIRFVNRAWLETLGYQEKELSDISIFDLIHPECLNCGPEFKSIVCGGTAGRFETTFITKDKQKIVVEGDVSAITENGRFAGTRGIFRDITERKLIEEYLQKSEKKYRELFDHAGDALFIFDLSGRMLDVNELACQRLRYSREELMKMSPGDIDSPDEAVNAPQRVENLIRNGSSIFETVHMCKDGTAIDTEVGSRIIEFDGNPAILSAARDIRERRKLEEQLRQSQKMESIGTLAGGVAHDFNNILTAIIGYGNITLMKMAPDDPNRPNIEQMLQASDRAAHLTRDLLLFSRKQSIERRPVDLNEIIENMRKFLLRLIGEDIELRTALHDGQIPILADAHQIQQVLMNLSANARDAMKKGGLLTITSEMVSLDSQFITLHGFGKPGRHALLTFSDTGEGMDEHTTQKIFEPFFTTKEVGKGTGLGLAVVYGIIKQHEGHITVYSEPGRGTTYKIHLPVIESDAEGEEPPAAKEHPVGGVETILHAEDNESVRNLTVSVLQGFGYTVITAVDGDDAVNKYRENKDSIQLLLFDLIMPKKSGKEAYDEIRKIRPDIKTIFLSGYSPDFVRDRTSPGNDAMIVYKPITPMDLLKKVRSMLDEGKT